LGKFLERLKKDPKYSKTFGGTNRNLLGEKAIDRGMLNSPSLI
jgi:hypothetical protein